MVIDIEPVSYIPAISIDREGFALERREDDLRDELLRKLVGSIIVRAIRYDHRESIGPVPGTDEVVGGCLTRRVGGTRVVGRRLGEVGARRISELNIDIIGRDIDESEPLPLLCA